MIEVRLQLEFGCIFLAPSTRLDDLVLMRLELLHNPSSSSRQAQSLLELRSLGWIARFGSTKRAISVSIANYKKAVILKVLMI
jgi:hypothetical protein